MGDAVVQKIPISFLPSAP